PHGDLLPHGTERAREAPRLSQPAAAQRAEQAIQRRRTRAQQGRPHRGRDHEAVMALEGAEQRWQDGAEQLAGQGIAGRPDQLEERQALTTEPRRPSRPPARGAGVAPQAADRRLAMTACCATVLVQNPAALALVGEAVLRPQYRGILSARSFGHGASFPVSWV